MSTLVRSVVLPLIITCICSIHTFSQQDLSIQWQHIIGGAGDEGSDALRSAAPYNVIAQCSDGGYVMVSTVTYNPNSSCNRQSPASSMWLTKFNKLGVFQWEHCYGGMGSFYKDIIPTAVIQTSDGGFALTGATNYTDGDYVGPYEPILHGDYDAFVTKTDSLGTVQWSRAYGGSEFETFNSIVEDSPGYFIAAGATASNDGHVTGRFWDDDDGWIVKLGQSGDIIWQKNIGTYLNDHEYLTAIKKASDGSFIAFGNVCVRISANGSVLWQNAEKGFDFSIDSKDNIYIAHINWDSQRYSSIIRKLNPSGNLLWEKKLFNDALGASYATNIHCLSDNTLAILGKTQNRGHLLAGIHPANNIFREDIYLAIVDSSGEVASIKCFGGTDQDLPTSVIPTKDKGFLVMGKSKSSDGDVFKNNGSYDWWLFKVGNYNTVKGRLFYDYNNNGNRDTGEDFYKNVIVASNKNGSINGSFAADGSFRHTVDTGAYVTTPLLNRPYFTSQSVSTLHDTYGHTDSIDFPVVPVPGIKDLAISLTSLSPQRPGFKNTLLLVCTNQGTEAIQQAEVFFFKDSRMNILSHDSTGFIKKGDTLCWKINNLEPQQSRTIEIFTRNAIPPALNVGDSLIHYIQVQPFAKDSSDYDNADTIRQNVIGSFDPNNKLDDKGGVMYYDRYKKGDYIFYTVNFQNTGTDTAFTVVIRDTLSAKLNGGSLEMVTSSHPFSMTIKNGSYLQWTFDNINLPDSNRNEKRSHGYVIYKIKPKNTLPAGDTVFNTASIYFDYNLPVQTNKNKTELKQRPLSKPVVAGLQNTYCRNAGSGEGKILNLPTGIAVSVKLDNSPLALAGDSTFKFDLSSLNEGSHIITVEFSQNGLTMSAVWSFTVSQPGVLDINLSANKTTINSPGEQVTISAVNATGGANFTYGFARDRDFTNLLQQDGTNNFTTISGASLNSGINWIYARIRANGQCYSAASNIDSIQISLNAVTGITDIDAPGRVIDIYPVPFTEYLLVTGLVSNNKYQFSLTNSYGKEVFFLVVSNSNSARITIPGLASGVYYLTIIKNKKKLGVAKVIKQ